MLRANFYFVVFFVVLLPSTSDVFAHGSMVVPESRVYSCYRNNPENPIDSACLAAKNVAGPQAFYDWNGINQANANGNHRAVVPDGQLCAGGQRKFSGLNLARPDWQATPIMPKANGTFDFEFWATAPHATRDWIFFVTRQGYRGNSPLKWGDVTEFCRLGSIPLSQGSRYIMNCPLPPVSGKHVIYTTWQRADSAEAFYTCTDVVLNNNRNSSWISEVPLRARSNLSEGSIVILRFFNRDGNDIENVQYIVGAGSTSAKDWALGFAKAVNSQSQYARIGILNLDSDVITPKNSAATNLVYIKSGLELSYEIDIQFPVSTSRHSAESNR